MSFKFPDFLNWSSLNSLRQKMDATLTNNFVLPPTFSEKSIFEKKLRTDGVDVDFEDVSVHDDGTLKYRNYRVLLHIRDIITINGSKRIPRYHLAFCRTLDQMKKQSRFQRYVVSQATSGDFQINIIHNGKTTSSTEKLKVCQNCLSKIEWEGFNNYMPYEERNDIVENFLLSEFFEKYPRDLIKIKPSHTLTTAPINIYTEDWKELSKKIRKRRGSRCENCGTLLDGSKFKFLHIHHRNGEKYDNRDSNLEVVCIRCHSNKPNHEHIKNSNEYKDFISKL